jgi:hypothetical protein
VNPTVARFWACVMLALIVLMGAANPLLGLVTSAVSVLVGASLWLRYVTDRRARRDNPLLDLPSPPEPPLDQPHGLNEGRRSWPNQPDAAVARSVVVAGVMPLALTGVELLVSRLFRLTLLQSTPYAERLSLALLFASLLAGSIYLSTLVDWYYVLPRVSGLVCRPPCRSRSESDWITVTRVWMAHRWLTTVLGPIVSGALMIGAFVYYSTSYIGAMDAKTQVTLVAGSFAAALLGAVVGVGLQFSLLISLDEILNPTRIIGQLVRYRGRQHYVVDVSLQGTKLNPVEGTAKYGGEPFRRKKGELVKWKDVTVDPTLPPFQGCDRMCSGVNYYCDNNWRVGRYK